MRPYVPIPYPAWRYHASCPAQIVKNAAEAAALGPDWSEAPVSTPAAPVAPDVPLDPPALPTDSAAPVLTGEAEKAAALHLTQTSVAVRAIKTIADIDTVELVRARELTNPQGPRPSILKALDKRRADLE